MRVLFVDDELTILNAVARMLRKEGHVLFFTTDPGTVPDVVRLERIDVIVSDQLMPHQLGTDLLRGTRNATSCQILMTGMIDECLLQQTLAEGIVDSCIRKPFAPETLRDALREAAERA